MRKIAVLSTNNNPDYFFYLPIVEWVWNKFGWEIALFITSDVKDVVIKGTTTEVFVVPDIEKVRTGTLAQVVRHFVSDVLPLNAYIMVQDIDLIPLKEWNPDFTKRTIYGWELTGKSFIPVHYTGMMGHEWYRIMDCTGDLKADMEREMKSNGRAYQEKWEDYWDADWDILTKKVLNHKQDFTFIERGLIKLGQDATPMGRIDRLGRGIEGYKITMQQDNWIDMHCENHNPSAPDKWEMIRGVLLKVFGEIPYWMDDYVINHHNKYGQNR